MKSLHEIPKNHKCVACDKSFGSKSSLACHKDNVHGGKAHNHKCEFCEKNFKLGSHLALHIKRVHDDTLASWL